MVLLILASWAVQGAAFWLVEMAPPVEAAAQTDRDGERRGLGVFTREQLDALAEQARKVTASRSPVSESGRRIVSTGGRNTDIRAR